MLIETKEAKTNSFSLFPFFIMQLAAVHKFRTESKPGAVRDAESRECLKVVWCLVNTKMILKLDR